jgi:hypothetical protein
LLPYFSLPYLFLRLSPLATQTLIVNTVLVKLVLALATLVGVELYVKPHSVLNGQLNVDLECVMHQILVTALELDSLVKIVPYPYASLPAPTMELVSVSMLALALLDGKVLPATSLFAMPLPVVELVIA